MPWLNESPGNQQPWYFLHRLNRSFLVFHEKLANTSLSRKMVKYPKMFLSSLKIGNELQSTKHSPKPETHLYNTCSHAVGEVLVEHMIGCETNEVPEELLTTREWRHWARTPTTRGGDETVLQPVKRRNIIYFTLEMNVNSIIYSWEVLWCFSSCQETIPW